MLKAWVDDGIDLKVELSTSGGLIVPGTNMPMPFVAGGTYGVPLGWTPFPTNIIPADYNLTTDTNLNRFSISQAKTTGAVSMYSTGAEIAFPTKAGFRYRIQCDVRTMDGKTPGSMIARVSSYKNNSLQYMVGSVVANPSPTDWTPVSFTTPAYDPPSDGEWRVGLLAGYLTSTVYTWGCQFRDLVITEIPPAPAPLDWRDISCDVKNMAIRHGRERFTQRYDIASCTLVLVNEEGEYSFAYPHPFNLRPGRQLKVTATYQGTTYPMYFGVIDSLVDGYTLDGHAFTTITCYDVASVLSNQQTPTLPYANGSLLSGNRMRLIIEASGYPFKTLDAGQFWQQGVTGNGRSLRDEAGVGADSEGGSFFADRSGYLIYKDRTWVDTDPNLKNITANLMSRPHDDGMTTIVDGIPELAGAPIICTNEMNTQWSLDRLINHVELSNAGGTLETFDDETSQANYGVFTYQRMDYVNYQTLSVQNGYLATRADDLMESFKDAKQRVNSIAYRPGVDPTYWPWTLGVYLNWLVRVWYAHPTNGWGYAIATHVQSVEHRISTKGWETVIALDQPIAYTNAPIHYDITDNWDRAVWDLSYWRAARFTDKAYFNLAAFETTKKVSAFDTAKFDQDRFT